MLQPLTQFHIQLFTKPHECIFSNAFDSGGDGDLLKRFAFASPRLPGIAEGLVDHDRY